MILTGDINLGNVTNPNKPFEFVANILFQEDIVFGNLEGCLSDVIDPNHYMSKSGWRNPGSSGAPALKVGGFDAVGCANNVTTGKEAILESLAVLDELGISYTGAGPDLTSARTPVILEREGVRFGFLQYTSVFWPFGHQASDKRDATQSDILTKQWNVRTGVPDAPLPIEAAAGVATIKAHTAYLPNARVGEMPAGPATTLSWPDSEYLKAYQEDISALRERVDVLVASHHWGISGSDDTQQYQVGIAHAAIDAGADLVMGHGPHVIQPIEVYDGKPIFYSLGNFHFGWEGMGPDWVGLIVRAEIQDKAIARVNCSPVREDNHTDRRTIIRTVNEERDAMEHLISLSHRFGTKLNLSGDSALVLGCG